MNTMKNKVPIIITSIFIFAIIIIAGFFMFNGKLFALAIAGPQIDKVVPCSFGGQEWTGYTTVQSATNKYGNIVYFRSAFTCANTIVLDASGNGNPGRADTIQYTTTAILESVDLKEVQTIKFTADALLSGCAASSGHLNDNYQIGVTDGNTEVFFYMESRSSHQSSCDKPVVGNNDFVIKYSGSNMWLTNGYTGAAMRADTSVSDKTMPWKLYVLISASNMYSPGIEKFTIYSMDITRINSASEQKPCNPIWTCSEYTSVCQSDGKQYRNCNDGCQHTKIEYRDCELATEQGSNPPPTEQTTEGQPISTDTENIPGMDDTPQKSSWLQNLKGAAIGGIFMIAIGILLVIAFSLWIMKRK
jgi:hypothetical protein